MKISKKISKPAKKTARRAESPGQKCACGCGSLCDSPGARRKAAKGLPTWERGHDHRALISLTHEFVDGTAGLIRFVREAKRAAAKRPRVRAERAAAEVVS